MLKHGFMPTLYRRRLHGRRGLKFGCLRLNVIKNESPPSRAAWIEMYDVIANSASALVAAFTGGVD